MFATLPQATASFGAVASDGWLYVYGGHVSPTHAYFGEAVSGRLDRLRLTGEPLWEELPSGPLVHQGSLYVSVADGTLLRLNKSAVGWEKAGASTPRLAHRLASRGENILVMGGANKGNNSNLIETIAVRQ